MKIIKIAKIIQLKTGAKIKISKSNDLFIANWSLSETPIFFRERFFKIIKRTKQLKIAAMDVASAKPACFRGPLK